MNITKSLFIAAVAICHTVGVYAQQTYQEMPQLTVNEQVTTVITATEPRCPPPPPQPQNLSVLWIFPLTR